MEIAVPPLTLVPCGHHLCGTCLQHLRADSPYGYEPLGAHFPCPMCKAFTTSFVVAVELRNALLRALRDAPERLAADATFMTRYRRESEARRAAVKAPRRRWQHNAPWPPPPPAIDSAQEILRAAAAAANDPPQRPQGEKPLVDVIHNVLATLMFVLSVVGITLGAVCHRIPDHPVCPYL
jgi:hypothetical protein